MKAKKGMEKKNKRKSKKGITLDEGQDKARKSFFELIDSDDIEQAISNLQDLYTHEGN